VSWFSDAVDTVGGVISDGFDALGSLAGDVIDVGADVFSAAGDVAMASFDVAGAGWDAFGDAATSVTFGIADTFGDVWDVGVLGVGELAFDAVIDPTLTAMEDSGFFDVLQVATIGMVEVEYSDAGLSMNYGIEDVFGFGVAIGEHGIAADVDTFGAGVDAAIGDEGFSAGGSLGWDWGPLPSADAHVYVDPDVGIGIGSNAQGPDFDAIDDVVEDALADPLGTAAHLAEVAGVELPLDPNALKGLDLDDDPLGSAATLARAAGLDVPPGPDDLSVTDLAGVPDPDEIDVPALVGVPDPDRLEQAVDDVLTPPDLPDIDDVPDPGELMEDIVDGGLVDEGDVPFEDPTSALDDAFADANDTIEDL
jgi:hypothetical protein